ncbi:MAG: hypothetical protein J07HQW1_03308 [Haloquadratum walsbyi J07HQW1]|uniref:Uncharacterized protein n=1 Tax=Haloquadratum walsbyi J07HQW1 TaxID=1238424 RepID=U1N9L3_9EURY|nr:MAG: hypothetical protein J07HQW1_03308 [Haloquadratum walsbyi J07HQW1]
MTPRPTVKYLGVTSKPRGFTVLGHHRTPTPAGEGEFHSSSSRPPRSGWVGLGRLEVTPEHADVSVGWESGLGSTTTTTRQLPSHAQWTGLRGVAFPEINPVSIG